MMLNLGRNRAPRIPSLLDFLNSLHFGVVLTNQKGKIFSINKSARQILGQKLSTGWQACKEVIKITIKSKRDIISDYKTKQRVLRFTTQHINQRFRDNGVIIAVSIKDVTHDWAADRQKDILEYITSALSQAVRPQLWIKTIFERIVIMMQVKACSLMIYDSKRNVLRLAISTEKIKPASQELKIGQAIPGLSVKKKMPLSAYDIEAGSLYKSKRKAGQRSTSLLSIPMFTNKGLVGVFNIRDRHDKFFREQDSIFYSIIANRLATTLEQQALIENLEKQRARLAAVITSSDQSKILVGSKGQIIMANPAFGELLQIKLEHVTGKKLTDLIPELAPIMNKEQTQYYQEIELPSLEGKPWVGVHVAKIIRAGVNNIVLNLRDITAEKNLDQLKNDFISTATHELRTPLTAILGYLSMLSGRGGLDEKQALYIQRMEKASKNLFDLVEDLLSVLRLEQEKSQLNPQPHALSPIIKEIIHSLEAKINNKKIKIALSKLEAKAFADTSALQKILVNLVDNAIKYSKMESKIQIKVTTRAAAQTVRIDVKDAGVGVPKKEQKNIFEKFHRVHNIYSVEAGGTGLGLYISRRLAEQSGGNLVLAESSAKGSTFSLTLPATKKEFMRQTQKKSI